MGKSPTGNRPVPQVTAPSTPKSPSMNKSRPAAPHKNMPAPKTQHGNRSNPSAY